LKLPTKRKRRISFSFISFFFPPETLSVHQKESFAVPLQIGPKMRNSYFMGEEQFVL
jgi:hypothetical protein